MSPPVSIVIPAFNAADDLRENLPPLLQQARHDEILVIDDASSDSTAAVARDLGARVLIQPQNSGPAAARNRGAREAREGVLVFLDSDCRVTPGWRDALLAPLRDPRVVAVKAAYLTDQTRAVPRLCQVEFEERYRLLRRAGSHVDFVDSFSMAVRRSVFLETGGFDESYTRADNEDVDLSFRLAAQGHPMAFAPSARVIHRHPPSWRAYFRLKLSRGYYRARVYERYPGKAVRDDYTPQGLKLQILALASSSLAIPLLAWSGLAATAAAGSAASLFAASSIPFLSCVARHDPRALPWAPAFLFTRALALGTGFAARRLGLPGPRPK